MERDRKLKIWLIKESEALPLGTGRLMRTGSLAEYLSREGHDVTWWASTFIHKEKRYFCDGYREIDVNEHQKLILLHSGCAYHKNVSLKRIANHQDLAWSFRRHSKQKPQPDIILCSMPTTQFAKEAIRYGRRHGVPVVIDVRDLWPDVFVSAVPKWMRGIADLGLLPWKWSIGRTLKAAAAIVGVMPNALEWGCEKAGRAPGELDRHIFIGCDEITIDADTLQKQLDWWSQFDVRKDTWNISFFTSLGYNQDTDTLIKAVKLLSERYPDIRLVIGGKGDAEESLKALADGHPAIVFPGWLDQNQMNSVMTISKCGMYIYKNEFFGGDGFGNKAVQYLVGGLPIITSMTGFSFQFIREHQIGEIYTEGDVSSCAQAIERLYLDEPRRRQMAVRAREQFEKTFAFSIVNKLFEDELYDVLEAWGR